MQLGKLSIYIKTPITTLTSRPPPPLYQDPPTSTALYQDPHQHPYIKLVFNTSSDIILRSFHKEAFKKLYTKTLLRSFIGKVSHAYTCISGPANSLLIAFLCKILTWGITSFAHKFQYDSFHILSMPRCFKKSWHILAFLLFSFNPEC